MFRSLMAASALMMTGAAAFADHHSTETSNMVCVEAGTVAPTVAAVTAAGDAVERAGFGAVRICTRRCARHPEG
ncbi:MAG: hypothetical protein AAFQ24_00335 [Pseudomonadota bacterium]